MQNHYDLIIQDLASRTPPRVVAIVRAFFLAWAADLTISARPGFVYTKAVVTAYFVYARGRVGMGRGVAVPFCKLPEGVSLRGATQPDRQD